MNDLLLALRLARRDFAAGELRLLALALALAVAAVSAVGLFVERTRLALEREAGQLIGADLAIRGDRPLADRFAQEAARMGLASTPVLGFRSMAGHGETAVLTELTIVAEGYPLRGRSRIAPARGAADAPASAIPAPGSIWADERLLGQLGVDVGAEIAIGARRLRLAAVLTRDPSLAVAFLAMGPRVVMNRADLDSTGLIQPGSRVSHRLLVAGEAQASARYREWAQSAIGPGQRIETVSTARPEVRATLDRAERYIGLAALTSVVLAAVAVMLASRRFLARHLDACALMRCLGVSGWRAVRLFALEFMLIGAAASVVGVAAGVAAQQVLASILVQALGVALPPAGVLPATKAVVLGFALLAAFGLPPLVALAKVPALRVLRRDLGAVSGGGIAAYLLAVVALAAMVYWHAGSPRLGHAVLGGFVAAIVLYALLAAAALQAIAWLRSAGGVGWRYGIASLRRRAATTITQTVALAIGLMALMTLTLVRGDLLDAWRASLPLDAPNRFLVNIQPDQTDAVAVLLAEAGIVRPQLYPMVRGRLVAVNDKPVGAADYSDDRARRLVEREFNLSAATQLPTDNAVVGGRWFGATAAEDGRQFSVEAGLAATLRLSLGDRLTFDIAGAALHARITSLRSVDWGSMRPNFFVLSPPDLLAGQPATFIGSVHVPPGRAEVVTELVRRHPNVLVIDIAAVMEQVRTMIGQIARAMQVVFLFTLAAGLLVLYAGIASTHDERLAEAALMRALGARQEQLYRAHAAEFLAIGAMAGMLGAAGAAALGYVVADKVLEVAYRPGWTLWLTGALVGALGVCIAGLAASRRAVRVAPAVALRG